MYNKNDIDTQAEREACTLRKQGKANNGNYRRIRLQENYNKIIFEKLFAK